MKIFFKNPLKIINFTVLLQQQRYIVAISYYITNVEIIILLIAFLGAIGIFKNLLNFAKDNILLNMVTDSFLFILLVLSMSSIAISTYNPFLYFRF